MIRFFAQLAFTVRQHCQLNEGVESKFKDCAGEELRTPLGLRRQELQDWRSGKAKEN